MSIVNDAAAESIRQSQLFSQLADLSYKAVNGKRQSMRDFAKGMLNIGKLGEQMEVPKDEITKDMILDYKREQEEKLYEGNKLYQSSGVPDLEKYIPLYSGDEVNFEGKKAEIQKLNEQRLKYINMSKAIESEIIEIKKRLDYFLKITGGNKKIESTIPEIKYKTEELAKKQEQKNRILENLRDVENQFRIKFTEAQQAKENIKANETEKIRVNDVNKQLIKDIDQKFNLLNRDRISVTKQPNETDEQYFQRIKDLEATTVDPNIYSDKAALQEIKKLKVNLKKLINDPSKIEDIIKSFPNPQDIYILNVNWTKIGEFLKSKYGVNNKFTLVNEYIDEITQALQNIQSGTFKTVLAKQPKTTRPTTTTGTTQTTRPTSTTGTTQTTRNDEPSLTSSFLNPILARQTALQADIARYREGLPTASLSLMPRDQAQQEDIARVRAAEAEVQARAAQAATQAIIQRERPGELSFAEVTAAARRPGAAAGPGDEYQLYDFVNDNTLTFISNGQEVFIKIGKFNRKFYILYSLSGDENSFSSFEFDDEDDPNYFDRILRSTGLLDMFNYPTDIYNQVFAMYNKKDIYSYLKNQVGLKETTGLKERTNTRGKTIIGYGIKKSKKTKKSKVIKGRGMQQIDEKGEFEHKEEIPKIVNFGNKKILLNKLYYRNILSVKDNKGHSVEKLPNTAVSDEFVKIIMTLWNNPQKKDYKNLVDNYQKLEPSEHDLMNLLLFITGLNKDKNIDVKRTDNVKKLKDRLQLVEAQINAGNNNIIVKKELKELVNKLYLFGAISLPNARAYLKQY